MIEWWQMIVLGILGGLLALWLVLVLVLWIEQRRHPGGASPPSFQKSFRELAPTPDGYASPGGDR